MIILAAGLGTRLRPLTDSVPKCLVKVGGKTLLDWQLLAARAAGVSNIAIVRGHGSELIERPGVIYFDNPAYETTNMVESLWCAEPVFNEGIIVSYGDIIYEPSVLERLLASEDDIGVVVDRGWRSYWDRRFEDVLSDAETLESDHAGLITSIGQKAVHIEQIGSQYIGLMSFRGLGVNALREVHQRAHREAARGRKPLRGQRPVHKLYMTDILQGIIDSGFPVHEVPICRGWLEIDSLGDLDLAESLVEVGAQGLTISA